MIHFKGKTTLLMDMPKDSKKRYLENVDLLTQDFDVKFVDFGLSKQLHSENDKMNQFCGTLLYMSP